MILPAKAMTALFLHCAPQVAPSTLEAVIKTESGGDPYVINNIRDHISKAFTTESQAVLYAVNLSKDSKPYSAGLMQIYSGNFKKYKVNNQTVFDPCTNITVGAKILTDNYLSLEGSNTQNNLRQALSIYYSGNKKTGFIREKNSGNTSYIDRIEKNTYLVPALKAETTITNSEPKPWDVFGDFIHAE